MCSMSFWLYHSWTSSPWNALSYEPNYTCIAPILWPLWLKRHKHTLSYKKYDKYGSCWSYIQRNALISRERINFYIVMDRRNGPFGHLEDHNRLSRAIIFNICSWAEPCGNAIQGQPVGEDEQATIQLPGFKNSVNLDVSRWETSQRLNWEEQILHFWS